MSSDSNQHSGRPSMSTNADIIEKVRTLIMVDRCLTIWELLMRVAAKFVPKLLSLEQQQLRLEVAQDMLECANRDLEFLNTVITGDQSWVYGYDPETKVQASQWKHLTSARPEKAQQVGSNVK
ncbi:uncharacterized protein LOC111874803, partial [Cryptotermes secundus]|uniref:uncharacterized protein LOC111874803 n=1 Tax=Cryptotermes secundus TaxID=105785 RepID=UPI000CD7CA2F